MAELAAAQARAEKAHERAERARQEAERARQEADGVLAQIELARDERRKQAERDWKKQWGELANRLGTLAEDIVAPGVPDILKQFAGVERLEVAANRVTRGYRDAQGGWHEREFDYVAKGGGILLVNETKSTLRPENIADFVAALREVRSFFPESAGCEIIGSLAALTMDPSLVAAGERHGLLMLVLATGLRILNSPGFRPTRY